MKTDDIQTLISHRLRQAEESLAEESLKKAAGFVESIKKHLEI